VLLGSVVYYSDFFFFVANETVKYTFTFDLNEENHLTFEVSTAAVTRVTFHRDHIDATSPQPLAPVFNMLRSRLAAFLLFPLLSLAHEQTVMSKAQPAVSDTTQTLADLLTIEPSASIFYDYARGVNLGNKLNDKSSVITVLVPMNKAVMKLARKP